MNAESEADGWSGWLKEGGVDADEVPLALVHVLLHINGLFCKAQLVV